MATSYQRVNIIRDGDDITFSVWGFSRRILSRVSWILFLFCTCILVQVYNNIIEFLKLFVSTCRRVIRSIFSPTCLYQYKIIAYTTKIMTWVEERILSCNNRYLQNIRPREPNLHVSIMIIFNEILKRLTFVYFERFIVFAPWTILKQ